VLCRHARPRLDWLVGFLAAGAAWAAGQVVACVVGGVWLVQELLIHPNARIGASDEGLSRVAEVVAALVYGLNLTTLLILRGMGMPLRQVDGSTSKALEFSPLLQVGVTVVAVSVLVLAGYLAQTALRRRYDPVRVVTRMSVSVAVLTTVLSRVALLRVHAAGSTGGITASTFWVFLVSLVEAGVLGSVGAQLALRGSLPTERVWGLRWFSGPVLGTIDVADTGDAGVEAVAPKVWSRTLTTAVAALVVVPLLLATVVPAVVGRESPAAAVRRYLEHIGNKDAAGVARDVRVPEGGDELLSAKAAAAMIRENPRQIEDVKIGETHTTGDTTVVEVTFRENGTALYRSFEVAKAKHRRRLGFFPVWVVVLPSVQVSIQVPAGTGDVTVDGLRLPAARPGNEVTVEVLDGPHYVKVAESGLLGAVANRIDTARERRVTLEARLSARGEGMVQDAVRAYFEGCAKSSSISTSGCLQNIYPRGYEQQNVAWSLKGDPTGDLKTALGADGVVFATGSYTMTVTYDWSSPGFFSPPETGHEADEATGTYYLRFAIDGDKLRLISVY
jgi:hypothetical protein